MNGRTMKDIFDFETVSPETVYEFMTETDYENKLYGPLFLEWSLQQDLVSSLERSIRWKEITLTKKQKKDMIDILKRTKAFDTLRPNPWGLPWQFQRLIDICIQELEK